jgi:pimeloyl-ACP methyl ester carboxylesterase
LKTVAAVVLLVLLALAFWLWTPDRDRARLEALYMDRPTDWLEIAGARLHVRDTGPRDAAPLVLLHGFGASLHTWDAWAQGLQGEFRVIRFDLPGSGLSPPDPGGDYSDARSMQLVAGLLDALGLSRAHIVGHSIGGRIAWNFADRYPQHVHTLVLVAPDGFASPGFTYGEAAKVPATLALMRYVLPKPVLRMSLEPAYANPLLLTDTLVTRYHDLMLAPGARDALLARLKQTVLRDPVPVLRRIAAPTLLMWGERDAMIPFANSADYTRALPRSTLVALPGVGHLPHEEAPAQSLPPLQDFLRQHR